MWAVQTSLTHTSHQTNIRCGYVDALARLLTKDDYDMIIGHVALCGLNFHITIRCRDTLHYSVGASEGTSEGTKRAPRITNLK